ncbi:hypothetical protein [Thermococcus gammatolerans]|uniref:KaiC-like domain-containing protein n=1 Tax=Thermococcus gammatolerans (strain DSM 15229 / JCM 11827 / EJ3) TaxID=593117 RepID=C5A5J9_THEGJ|nr:hypothetical protein [Thermococcus gammatolerans]ACS33511.1 Conserved hypothetical protein [Thermococcus gammatolerans EJ3]
MAGDYEEEFPVDQFMKNFIPGSILAIIYETYSNVWELPFVMAKEFVERDWAVVITNYIRPVEYLLRDLKLTGLNAEESLNEDRLFIIDVFGSRYGLRNDKKNVFYLDSVDPETLNPKILRIYQDKIIPKLQGKRLLRIVYPLHGVTQIAGEEATVKMFGQLMAQYSKLQVESFMVLPLNKDTVSKSFTAWIVELSDYVLLSKVFIGRNQIEEHLYFLKAPLRDFKPEEYLLIKTGKTGRERFGIRKIKGFSP